MKLLRILAREMGLGNLLLLVTVALSMPALAVWVIWVIIR